MRAARPRTAAAAGSLSAARDLTIGERREVPGDFKVCERGGGEVGKGRENQRGRAKTRWGDAAEVQLTIQNAVHCLKLAVITQIQYSPQFRVRVSVGAVVAGEEAWSGGG